MAAFRTPIPNTTPLTLSEGSIARYLEYMRHLSPQWTEDVEMFAALNPEYIPFMYLAPCPDSVGSNSSGAYARYPGDDQSGDVKTFLKFYALEAGVRATYAHARWEEVKNGDLSKLTEKKRTIMEAIDKLPPITTLEQLNQVTIKGVGVGCKSAAAMKFFGATNVSCYTDRGILTGLEHVYGGKMTVSRAKKITEGWKGRRDVGDAWTFKIFRAYQAGFIIAK